MGTTEHALRSLMVGIKTRPDLIAESRRTTDLPPWVHTALLAEYDCDAFLSNMRRGAALKKHCDDVGMPWQPSTVQRWIKSFHVWRKTNVTARMKLTAEIYYHEAARSTKYRNNTWNATKSVVYQSTRRQERSFNSYTNAFASFAHVVEANEVEEGWISQERAQELLEMLPKIAAYLRLVAAKKTGKSGTEGRSAA